MFIILMINHIFNPDCWAKDSRLKRANCALSLGLWDVKHVGFVYWTDVEKPLEKAFGNTHSSQAFYNLIR
jgi:hypothetical protein